MRFVNSVAAEPGMLAPDFFLASLLSEPCRACVVVVSDAQDVVGLVYCKERKIMGIPIGIVIADDTLGTMVAARPEEADAVIRCAVRALLKHKVALRWRVTAARLPLLEGECGDAHADIHFRPKEHHAHLTLPPTYNEFLTGVGRSTRHNLNRYRRRSELAGNEFCSDQTFEEFCAAAERLLPDSAYTLSKQELKQALAMIGQMPSRLLVGIRHNSGGWISLAGLWFTGNRAFMTLQLNDRRFVRESISTVLRSSLIEHLIGRGIRQLVFLDGVSAPLSHYADRRREFTAYIDSRSLPWRLVRRGCVTMARLAPATFANWRAWRPSDSPALSGQ